MQRSDVADALADLRKFRAEAVIAIAGIERELRRGKTLSTADRAGFHRLVAVLSDVANAIHAECRI
jgi:hypothetical protein